MTEPSNAERAIQRAKEQSNGGRPFPAIDGKVAGWCALRVRELYGAPSSGDADHDRDADAVDVFYRAAPAERHRLGLGAFSPSMVLPRGVPFIFTGGSSGHGHIVVTTGRGRGIGSLVWSPDTVRAGYFDRVTIENVLGWMTRSAPLGWVESIGGVPIDFDRKRWHSLGGPR